MRKTKIETNSNVVLFKSGNTKDEMNIIKTWILSGIVTSKFFRKSKNKSLFAHLDNLPVDDSLLPTDVTCVYDANQQWIYKCNIS
jgi:hypothetical protein